MKTPHDPTAATRSWTDAFPVSDRDADALDAWLDQQSAIARAGASSTPVESPGFDHNGQTSAAAAASNDTFPLTATAQRFHARLQDAERDHAPDVPEAAIWEKVMSNHLALEPALPAIKNGQNRTHNVQMRVGDSSPHPIRTFVGSNPAISAIFAIVVVIAIVAVFRGMSENGAGPVSTAPTGGESHLAAITNATPDASATAQASDCVVRTLTADEVKKLTADLLAAPAPTFLPTKGTAPESEASAAITTYTGAFSCRLNADQPADFNTFNLWSDRFFAETRLQYPTENRIVMQERRLAASRQLSPVLVDQDPTHYIVNTGDPAMQPYILQSPFGGNKYALLPKDFVVMADGRIGAPLKWAVPGGGTGYTKDDYTTPQSIPFLFFANVDGHWLLDQQINLCTWKCDQFYANEQAKIDRDRKWIAGQKQSTPAGTATPAASDPWIKPVTAAECTMPDTSGLSDSELIAITSRWYLACENERNNVQEVIPFFSSELLARHPELLKGQYTLQTADIESAKADSAAFADKHPQILMQGIAGADDNTTRTSGFYEVFLPRNAVVLPDGRIAIPYTLAFTDPAYFTRAMTAQTNDPKAPLAAGALVFVKDGDTWKIDQFGVICLANCDGFWSEQEAHIGTPSPSNDDLATATAEAAKRLPIPPASCAVPSATASASDLPDRGYNRIMLPTTGKADAASGAARNVIACIAGEPTSATPGSSLQPLMTNRLQQEFAAGRGEPALTSVQIDGARSISAYLEQQKTYKPYERAAEGANATPPAVSPAHLVGGSDNPTFGWYPIVLPENAIQFPDGRIGVPLTLMITSDDLWKHLASELSSQSNIYIFSLVDGTWQLDEVLPLCLGNCDAFWQEAMGTPASIGEEASLQPITPDDCAVPAPDTGAQPQLSSRAYRPVSVPDPSDSKAIVSTARDYLACSRYSTGNSLDPFMTDRFQTQLQGALANHGSSFLTQEDITAGKNLSAELAGGQGGYQFYVRGLPGADDTSAATPGFYEVVLPDNALLLPDGRIAMPITQAYTSDSGLKEAQASMSSVVSQTPYTVNVIIFASVSGAWKVDQRLPLCLQNCSDFWQQQEAQLGTPSSVASPSPQSSPIASPVAADPWLKPVLMSECAAPSASIPDGTLSDRSYALADAPQRNEADLIATASREYAACTLLSHNSIAQSQFKTERFREGGTLSISDTEITQGKSVSQAMSERGAPEVYRRAPADLVVSSSSVITEHGATGAILYTRVFLPQNAVVFADGLSYAADCRIHHLQTGERPLALR